MGGVEQSRAGGGARAGHLALHAVAADRSPRGRTLAETATAEMRSAGYKVEDGQVTQLNGLDAYVGRYRGSVKDLGKVVMHAAHVRVGREVYVVAGLAPEADFDRVDRRIAPSIASFRELSRDEADKVRPNRLGFYTVRQGDSWQSIAARAGKNLVSATTLAIMNDHEVEQPAAAGRPRQDRRHRASYNFAMARRGDPSHRRAARVVCRSSPLSALPTSATSTSRFPTSGRWLEPIRRRRRSCSCASTRPSRPAASSPFDSDGFPTRRSRPTCDAPSSSPKTRRSSITTASTSTRSRRRSRRTGRMARCFAAGARSRSNWPRTCTCRRRATRRES